MLLAALAMAQVSSELITPEIRRIGSRLACLCKSCKNTVGDCAMLACHYSKPARERIRDGQAAGKSDDAIVAGFVTEHGRQALALPPNDGFSSLAWWMPPMMVGFGLALIYWFIRRMRKPAVPAAVSAIDQKVLDRYKESIEKDLAKLD
ncbi:MAG: cytochrome c-type biogenesis protein CcmH [Acidobacteria bacterium]|nr:cytochrome c-type biogenesis protein CcmH [Acidobacteriota bacterium]